MKRTKKLQRLLDAGFFSVRWVGHPLVAKDEARRRRALGYRARVYADRQRGRAPIYFVMISAA
jgi:hypothetical protein